MFWILWVKIEKPIGLETNLKKEIVFKRYSKLEKIFFDKFIEKLLDCYYTNDRVLVGLGLDLNPPFPTGNDVETGDFSLLNPVKQRGEFFRKA